MKQIKRIVLPLLLALGLVLSGCAEVSLEPQSRIDEQSVSSLSDIPAFSEDPYVVLNDNQPEFDDDEKTTEAFEYYSELDELGRCGVTFANVCRETMPTEERGSISSVKPTGWVQAQYDFVDGKALYNRCHLIGYQLTAENANKENLITGTRYMNTEGMLPFENLVADYVKETDNHVLYRVTPIFEGDNLVASGVQMEALSVEDDGDGICFNVYCYNNQPGVEIDYATGENWLAGDQPAESAEDETTYILNTSGKKFHKPDCSSVKQMKESNKQSYTGSRDMLIQQGYEPCKQCKP
ncbi:MAG: DNA/RNA non-specific endonuclease [Butyricicoccus sp.]